jgi:hypothetical protein
MKCDVCGNVDFEITEVRKNRTYIHRFLRISNKASPAKAVNIITPNIDLNKKESLIA